MDLREYRKKRDFRQTQEPAGHRGKTTSQQKPFFVVQKHAARRLHYDFRLEMDGVLKSWAIPKGFPTRRGDKRLAVHVEDHPIDYANFEGTIPAGNYGAGTVMVWDKGSYQVHADDPIRALESGKLHLTLAGWKLKGDWTLVKIQHPREGDKDQWLILKSGADAPAISARAEDRSVLTNRSLEQIAAANDAQWTSNGGAAQPEVAKPSAQLSATQSAAPKLDVALKKLPRSKAAFVEPMKCLLVDTLPKGPDWTYELKFDGYRALAIKNKRKLSLVSRNANDLTAKYPRVAEALQRLPCRQAVLDGELVALDSEGKSSFQLLQSYNLAGAKRPPIFYYAFDLLNLDERDLTGLPLTTRKKLLEELLQELPKSILFSASIDADSTRLMREMQKRGLEGIIAKRRDSKYEIGRRSGAWVKFKWTNEQEFVIGGYTPPKGGRSHFGAILVGYYQNGDLMFASKVGTGFSIKTLQSLHKEFQKLTRRECPFANLPEDVTGGLTAAEMKRCTWLEPRLVCQIRFTEWTRDHHLRHPAFLGLREDKAPTKVVREKPA